MTPFIIAALCGYLLGSIPAAYLIVKLSTRHDIRDAGSGNVGTMNALEVTQSKTVGVAVLVADMVKGVAAALLPALLFPPNIWLMGAGGVAAIVGHNYPVWLRFRGGRGLATTAGMMLVMGWIFIIVWLVFWVLAYIPWRNIHIGNVAASVLCPLALVLAPFGSLSPLYIHESNYQALVVFGSASCALILLAHSGPMREFFKKQRLRR